MVPEVMFSRPASMRSRVDLPQPEGPTSTTNSPSSIGTVTPCRTSKAPNDFRTSRILTDDIHFSPWSFRRRSTSAVTASVLVLTSRRKARSDRCIVRSLYGFGNCSISNPLVALSISLVPDEGCDMSGVMGRKRAKTGKIRLTEVAKLAGVSPITASRFFRTPEALSAERRVRVESAANELGYVPNLAARALASQRTEVIGVLIPSFTNNVFSDVLRGIYDAVDG